MGSLRTIFALAVVFAHVPSQYSVGVGGRNAVQLFYIISGFLISYVLTEARTYKTVASFYVNRYLRLYPIYLVVALAVAAGLLLHRSTVFLETYRVAPKSADLLLMLSNLLIFGQDWVMFFAVKGHHLVFSGNFMDSDVILYHGLLIHQAWTLGVELSFYLIAPFVLPRRTLSVSLLLCSVLLRVGLIFAGIGLDDPWTYRFFPTELALFLAGSLAHQVLLPWYRKLRADLLPKLATAATGFVAAFAILYAVLPINAVLKNTILLGSFVLLVPLTFLFQNRHRLDARIGNLSYPIYICHLLVISTVSRLVERYHVVGSGLILVVSLPTTLLAAVALDQWVAKPFERLRRQIKQTRNPSLMPLIAPSSSGSSLIPRSAPCAATEPQGTKEDWALACCERLDATGRSGSRR